MKNLSKQIVQQIFSKPKFQFTLVKSNFAKDFEYTFEPVLDLYAKKFRKVALEAPILHRQKLLIPAKRLRTVEDKLIKLKNNNECPAVITQKENFEDLDIVLDQKQIFNIKRRKDLYTESFYIKVRDQEIRCTVSDIYQHPIQNWIICTTFQRYIVGKPNLLRMPIFLKPTLDNVRLNRGADFNFKKKLFWVYSYNNDYPTRIEIDPSNITHMRGYKTGDLANMLPDGMVLHEKYKSNLHMNIIEIGGDTEKIVEQELKRQQLMAQVDKGIIDEEKVVLSSGQKKDKAKKKLKIRSLKKIVQQMSQEQKDKLVVK